MASPMAVGGRLISQRLVAGPWRWPWRDWLAALRAQHPEPESAPGEARASARESPAFVDLFTRYHLPLIDYLYGMTRDQELAADLAQDTFTRAYAAAPELAGIAEPRAWLYRIATNGALNASRRQRRFEWLPLSRVEPEAGAGDGTETAASWSALPPVEIPQSQGDLGASVAERDACPGLQLPFASTQQGPRAS